MKLFVFCCFFFNLSVQWGQKQNKEKKVEPDHKGWDRSFVKTQIKTDTYLIFRNQYKSTLYHGSNRPFVNVYILLILTNISLPYFLNYAICILFINHFYQIIEFWNNWKQSKTTLFPPTWISLFSIAYFHNPISFNFPHLKIITVISDDKLY